ncbi:hypothetical protein DL96DRAFT_1559022 [Flagelloscypha sp. PMI_526]|nr:hypothetical protein DL96DRAFT_1559022 [Flagelloscypha sp. PMI_526]
MFLDVQEKFKSSWTGLEPIPSIAALYLITWPRAMQDPLRNTAKRRRLPKGKAMVFKFFRSEKLECRLDDYTGTLCPTIRTGFKSSLDYKRQMVNKGAQALEYSQDMFPGSEYSAMLVAYKERPWIMKPDENYDSVQGFANGSQLQEYIVYHPDAVRPAYLIMLKKNSDFANVVSALPHLTHAVSVPLSKTFASEPDSTKPGLLGAPRHHILSHRFYDTRFALWLVPSQAEASELNRIMMYRPPTSRHRDQHIPPNSRSYPRFSPHITLATFKNRPPNLSLRNMTKDIHPVVTVFKSAKCGNTYLGAFSLRIRITRDLQNFHRIITNELNRLEVVWQSRNFPHMSLFYVEEHEERKRLNKGLLAGGHIVTGSEVWLVDCCSSNVQEWKLLKRRSLSLLPHQVQWCSPHSNLVVHLGANDYAPPSAQVRRPQRLEQRSDAFQVKDFNPGQKTSSVRPDPYRRRTHSIAGYNYKTTAISDIHHSTELNAINFARVNSTAGWRGEQERLPPPGYPIGSESAYQDLRSGKILLETRERGIRTAQLDHQREQVSLQESHKSTPQGSSLYRLMPSWGKRRRRNSF